MRRVVHLIMINVTLKLGVLLQNRERAGIVCQGNGEACCVDEVRKSNARINGKRQYRIERGSENSFDYATSLYYRNATAESISSIDINS